MKNKKKYFAVLSIVLLVTVSAFSGCIERDAKHVTHSEVGLSVLKKDTVQVFYKNGSISQQALAEQCLDIIYEEYEICSAILGLPVEKLNSCSLVFCENHDDPYIKICDWFSYVDGVQCWPIIGEDNLIFKEPINVYLLYQMLPHEISDTTMINKINPVRGGWFVEGVSDYIKLNCTKYFNQLNNSFWLDQIYQRLENLSSQEERIVDLSNRLSFEGYGWPGSVDEAVFYVGSLVYVKYLVDNYGDDFIPAVASNISITYKKLRDVIEESTGYDIDDSIKNVSVGWIKEQYISLLKESDVNLTGY